MNTKNPFIARLLRSIEPLPHNVYDYSKLDLIDVDIFSLKAALLIFNLDDKKRSRWIPLSQIKKDKHNNIWLPNWLLDKIKTDDKND